MAVTVTMPQLGESVVEGTIAKWLVAEGEAVAEDQPLVEITTDKIDTEIPSPAAGVIGKILVPAGETVKIGTVLCEIAAGAAQARAAVPGEAARRPARAPEAVASAPPRVPPAPAAPPAAAPARPAPSGEAPAEAPGGAAPVASSRSALAEPGVALQPARVEKAGQRREETRRSGDGGGEVPSVARRVTPLVRKMAAEYGVDVSALSGSGVGGRVTKEDLLQHLNLAGMAEAVAETATYGDVLGEESARPEPAVSRAADGARADQGAAPGVPRSLRTEGPARPARPGLELRDYVPPTIQAGEGDRVEPFSKRRRIIAEHMVYSKVVSPHVYTLAEIDMSAVATLREAKKHAFRESEGVGLTYLHFVILAAARALRDHPRLNAVVGENELILRRDVNIGVAVETEQGLVVPVVRNADRLSLRGIAREVEELADKARTRKLRVEDLQGGTFTVSNPGREGNLVGFAVISQPQLGILRMGEVKKRPVVVELDGVDAIAIRPIMLMSLSYDHRVIDGVTGNSFLYRVKEYLERGEFEI